MLQVMSLPIAMQGPVAGCNKMHQLCFLIWVCAKAHTLHGTTLYMAPTLYVVAMACTADNHILQAVQVEL